MSKVLNHAFISSIILSLFCFTSQAAPICSEYLSEMNSAEVLADDLSAVTQKLVGEFNIYSPWYYSHLLKSVSENDISTFLTNVSDEELKEIADGIYLGLVDDSELAVDLDQMSLQQTALLLSLKAIQNSKTFPVKVIVKEEKFEGKKKLAKVMLALSAVSAVATPGVMYLTGLDSSMVATLGAASVFLSSSVVNFLASETKDFIEVDSSDLAQFILSEGQDGQIPAQSYFSLNEKGQLVVGAKYKLVVDQQDKIVIVNAGI
jgi:hypothetical protein